MGCLLTNKPLIIGFDQARVDDTGVCVIEYHPTGGGTPLYTDCPRGFDEVPQAWIDQRNCMKTCKDVAKKDCYEAYFRWKVTG